MVFLIKNINLQLLDYTLVDLFIYWFPQNIRGIMAEIK